MSSITIRWALPSRDPASGDRRSLYASRSATRRSAIEIATTRIEREGDTGVGATVVFDWGGEGQRKAAFDESNPRTPLRSGRDPTNLAV
jgi:hypothetical protein